MTTASSLLRRGDARIDPRARTALAHQPSVPAPPHDTEANAVVPRIGRERVAVCGSGGCLTETGRGLLLEPRADPDVRFSATSSRRSFTSYSSKESRHMRFKQLMR